MPELPEVETTRRGLAPLIGSTLSSARVYQPSLRWPIDVDFQTLIGLSLVRLERRAKYLIAEFSESATLGHSGALDSEPAAGRRVLVHLGMSGSLRIEPKGTERLKHDHVVLEFDLPASLSPSQKLMCDQLGPRVQLHYHDPRRFGAMLDFDAHAARLTQLGPEPLSDAFDSKHLFVAAKSSSRAIKTLIMDQAVVVGVGNIYATESLFLAGLSPKRPAKTLTQDDAERLVFRIKEVIAKAIDLGGSTLRDYRGANGQTGYFQQTLLAYGRAGEPCVNCQNRLINERIGQRASVFCEHCQR